MTRSPASGSSHDSPSHAQRSVSGSRRRRRTGYGADRRCPGAWQRVGPLSADVCSVAADPNVPSILYAGLRRGGLFHSADGGAQWSLMSSSPSRLCNLSVSRTDPQLLVALTGETRTTHMRPLQW